MITLIIQKNILQGKNNLRFLQRCFSSGDLWTSGSNPLPENEANQYSAYFDFKYGFGQGGNLTLRLNQFRYSLHFHTLWEDYAAVNVFHSLHNNSELPPPCYLIEESGEGGRNSLFSDESYSKNTIQDKQFKVFARVPEYYSYDVEVNGPIIHADTPTVSSKIYGNVRAVTPYNFSAKKLKTEKCEICADSINVETYLEGYNVQITVNHNIHIKKCAISGTANIISVKEGDIFINSLFTNPDRRHPNCPVNQIPNTDSEVLRQSIKHAIESGSHINISTTKGNIIITSSHGTNQLISNEGDISIEQVSNQQILMQANKGKVKAHFYHIHRDSYIEARQVQITLEESFKQNIYLINEAAYFGEFLSDQPTLFIKGDIFENKIHRKKGFGKLPSFMFK